MAVNHSTAQVPRLIAARVDFYGEHEPERSYASVPRSSARLEDGFREITYHMLASAVNKAAWWLDSVLTDAQSSASPPVFAYSGPNDIRYPVLVLASIKTGRKILLPSPFRSIQGYLNLFEATACNAFLCTAIPSQSSQFGELQARRPNIKQIVVPGIDEWLNDEQVSKYEYTRTEESAMDDPVMILHTSGTTGDPKPIVYTNRALLSFDVLRQLSSNSPPLIFSESIGKRVWTHFPLLHLGGMAWALFLPLYLGTRFVFGPVGGPLIADRPLSAELAQQVIEHGNVEGAFIAPFLISEMVRKPSTLACLSNLQFIHQGSAVLSQALGEVVSRYTRVSTIYGATELLLPPLLALEPEDWAYISFHPCAGAVFTPYTDDLYELSFVRSIDTDPKDKSRIDESSISPIFSIFSNIDHYQTKDLWEPHPTKPGLWRWRSRTDDIIVLSSGLKLNTATVQLAIQEHPMISTAVIGGHGRLRSFLLLELNNNNAEFSVNDEKLKQSLWTAVEAGNSLCAASAAHIARDFVIIASPSRPFARLPKGSVDKTRTFDLYREEIEKLYELPEAVTI